VTYRAVVTGGGISANISYYIQDWLRQGAFVAFEFVLVSVDSTCDTVVSTFFDPECTVQMVFQVSAIVGGVIGSLVIISVCLIVIVLIILLFHRQKPSKNTRYTCIHEYTGVYALQLCFRPCTCICFVCYSHKILNTRMHISNDLFTIALCTIIHHHACIQ